MRTIWLVWAFACKRSMEREDNDNIGIAQQPEEIQPIQSGNREIEEERTKQPKKGMSNGLKRLLTGLVLAGVMLFFLLYLRRICIHSFDLIGMFFVVMGGLEMRRALRAGGHNVLLVPQIVLFAVLYPLFFFFKTEGIAIAMALSACIAMVQFTFSAKVTLSDLGYTVFELFYPSVFVAMIMAVNWYAGDLIALFLLMAVPLVSDAAAYFVGSKFGKRKLFPSVSPNKTVAGFVGGIVGAMLAACGIMLLFDIFHLFDGVPNVRITALSEHWWASVLLYALLGVLIMAAGMVGDLVASRIKRQVGIKDYGRIFPGHGGVMDRMDSVIFAMPIVYLFFTIYNAVAGAQDVVQAVVQGIQGL